MCWQHLKDGGKLQHLLHMLTAAPNETIQFVGHANEGNTHHTGTYEKLTLGAAEGALLSNELLLGQHTTGRLRFIAIPSYLSKSKCLSVLTLILHLLPKPHSPSCVPTAERLIVVHQRRPFTFYCFLSLCKIEAMPQWL